MAKDKKISSFSAFLLGVDGMVGSAIFLLPGSLYAKAGNSLIGILFVSGVSALLLALCYAALSSETKQNGAAWLYAYKEFGRFAGFEVGFFTWFQGVITITTEIAAFLTSLKLFIPQLSDKLVYDIAGIAIVLIIAIIGLMGDRVSSIADNIATFLKIGVLLIFVLAGIWFIHRINFVSNAHYSFHSVNNAFSNAFYMFTGFAFLPVAAAQMRNPRKNLPRELLAVIISVTLLYIATVVVAIGTVGPSIAHSSLPLAIAFAKHFGNLGKIIITVGTVGSVLGVAISLSYSTPYVASSLANEHQLLPQFFGKKSKSGAPYVAIIITAGLCALLILSGGYLFLVPCTIIISLVQYFSTSLVMFVKQWRRQRHQEQLPQGAFNLRGGILVPVLSLLVCVYILVNLKLKVILFGIIALICGIALYFIDKLITKKAQIKEQGLGK
ncbi:APC family permease [Ligilactobacillus aviarius]|uniref:Amino acid permease n=1 Tax=Ligilactobacillus aviarius TaxID=1606 RepID=A0A510WQC0_9LACO|nr:APC family permease [Ligilactobacillus aviarius]KRM38406.1 amino acid permease-associated protein [Ligilactobacillus aviarius subsp. aviarius DSM 20655]GEK41408.1 amino acid permease [Ligilactobacillus aviarius]HJD08560.1 APC family permease [Candidatus Ligilactobacillus faecavium]